MNIESVKVLALIPTLLIGTHVLAASNTLTFSGECTAEMYGVSPETKSFKVQGNEKVTMRFRTVGVSTTVHADLTPDGTASLEWVYLIPAASNQTLGKTSLEKAKPGDKLNLYQVTYGGNPEITCSGVIE